MKGVRDASPSYGLLFTIELANLMASSSKSGFPIPLKKNIRIVLQSSSSVYRIIKSLVSTIPPVALLIPIVPYPINCG